VKFGGSLTRNPQTQAKFIKELAGISRKQKFILVHGGGSEVNAMLEKFSVKSKFMNGLRYTDSNVLDVVELVLSGKVNRIITTELIKNGVNAVGISGKDGKSVICKQVKELGFVGEPVKVNKKLIEILIDSDFFPVIASIASDAKGNVMNVNADVLAAAISVAFKAEKLMFLTDVPGVFDKNRKTINEIRVKDINALVKDETITDGMIPKIKSCADSVKKGVKEVWITSDTNSIKNIKGTVIKK
jgi:acetylglutamate kinase